MDEMDRTCPESFEIPEEVLAILRREADHGLERACDTMSNWDQDIRARVLHAAHTVDVFRFGRPNAHHVAELADAAVRWQSRPDTMPTTMEELARLVDRFDELKVLIEIRDRALTCLGHPITPEADEMT